MKSSAKIFTLIAACMLTGYVSFAQQQATPGTKSETVKQTPMKTYVIERNIPDAGKLTTEQLQAISKKSCSVLDEMGSQIQWDHSYVVGNKIYCIYRATSEELLKIHGSKGGFPVDNIYEVEAVISPATAKNN